jgi:hypothetical protein
VFHRFGPLPYPLASRNIKTGIHPHRTTRNIAPFSSSQQSSADRHKMSSTPPIPPPRNGGPNSGRLTAKSTSQQKLANSSGSLNNLPNGPRTVPSGQSSNGSGSTLLPIKQKPLPAPAPITQKPLPSLAPELQNTRPLQTSPPNSFSSTTTTTAAAAGPPPNKNQSNYNSNINYSNISSNTNSSLLSSRSTPSVMPSSPASSTSQTPTKLQPARSTGSLDPFSNPRKPPPPPVSNGSSTATVGQGRAPAIPPPVPLPRLSPSASHSGLAHPAHSHHNLTSQDAVNDNVLIAIPTTSIAQAQVNRLVWFLMFTFIPLVRKRLVSPTLQWIQTVIPL